MAFTVTVRCGEKFFKKEYSRSVLIADAVKDSGFTFDLPCNRSGICGNCKVFVNGLCNEITDSERQFIASDSDKGIRLACMAQIIGDAVIDVPIHYLPIGSRKTVSLSKNDPVSETKKCFACAVDIGTTTIEFKYFSLPDGALLYSERTDNPQRINGSDVVTRMEYAKNGGLDELIDSVNAAIEESRERFGREIEFYIVTANTVMMHLFASLDPTGMAVAPFTPKTLFGEWKGNRYLMRCADSYIGADVIASVLASRITESDSPAVLLDIGTNNECVLWDGKRLYACSSPAGPAFEGASISCGITARGGAIYKVEDDNGTPIPHTIDASLKPEGFCGSGLIDAVSFLLENGYIARDGSIKKPVPSFDGIVLTAEDISKLQLAKSAVCAGLLTLLEEAELPIDKVEKIYITGSFGNNIDPISAERIGMIPKGCGSKVTADSGFAIDGATMLLLDKKYIAESEIIARDIKVIELADSEFFAKAFIENLFFDE